MKIKKTVKNSRLPELPLLQATQIKFAHEFLQLNTARVIKLTESLKPCEKMDNPGANNNNIPANPISCRVSSDNHADDENIESDLKHPIYQVNADDFLRNLGRQFIYLTSIGQPYHAVEHFRSQLTCVINMIKVQLESAQNCSNIMLSGMEPFEIRVLIGDSLQAYSLSEKNREEIGTSFCLGEPDQWRKVLKNPTHVAEYIRKGSVWQESVQGIANEMIKEIITIYSNAKVEEVVFHSWSKEVDEFLECESNEKNEFERLMSKLESDLKEGIRLALQDESEYFISDAMNKKIQFIRKYDLSIISLFTLKYVIEEGVGLYYKIYPALFPRKSEKSRMYFGYPKPVGELFEHLKSLVEIGAGEILKKNIQDSLPKIIHLCFSLHDIKCLSQESVLGLTQFNSEVSERKESFDRMWIHTIHEQTRSKFEIAGFKILNNMFKNIESEHLENGWTEEAFVEKVTSLLKTAHVIDKEECVRESVALFTKMNHESFEIAHQSSNIPVYNKENILTKLLLDTLVYIQDIIPLSQPESPRFLRHKNLSQSYKNRVTLKLLWDPSNPHASIIKIFDIYLENKEGIGEALAFLTEKFKNKDARKHKAHATLIKDQLGASENPGLYELTLFLVKQYVQNYISWKDDNPTFKPASYAACYFFCFENLMGYHNIDARELRARYSEQLKHSHNSILDSHNSSEGILTTDTNHLMIQYLNIILEKSETDPDIATHMKETLERNLSKDNRLIIDAICILDTLPKVDPKRSLLMNISPQLNVCYALLILVRNISNPEWKTTPRFFKREANSKLNNARITIKRSGIFRNLHLSMDQICYGSKFTIRTANNLYKALRELVNISDENSKRIGFRNQAGYIVHDVLGDGACGYTAMGITREQAVQLLMDHIIAVKDMNLLTPVVKETLKENDFVNYLKSHGLIEADFSLEHIIENDNQYATDLECLKKFIEFDVQLKLGAGKGWPHPATLRALAHIQKITLYIWKLNENHSLKAHDQIKYAKNIHPESSSRVDLLFVNNNHFNLLEFFGFEGENPIDDNIPIFPLEVDLNTMTDSNNGISALLKDEFQLKLR